MKKVLVAAILGLGVASSALAQGVISIGNFLTPPYNQVYWNNTVAGIGAANLAAQNANVQVQVWYGLGVLADANSLTLGGTTSISTDPTLANYTPAGGTHGAGGYFTALNVTIPGWTSGTSVTFQLRAIGAQGQYTFEGSSALWQESTQIVSSSQPANAANIVPSLGVTIVPVPEPTTFAMLGLGAASMLIFRRRN
jgi:hypothetical protein